MFDILMALVINYVKDEGKARLAGCGSQKKKLRTTAKKS
jgi:hypothetical protein